ncbi:hypothetical protein [Terasakiella sp. SH-1]|uniref:hypothetical protein n=1 Tax=Terasakiella sp. SH-1 TaxID=2560057 RepID=UPI001F1169A7|nr:hypothetical protein [Terasakiella sp. SH-1]
MAKKGVRLPEQPARDYEAEDRQRTQEDMDSMYAVPLSILPLETTGLKRARMVKNVKLQSAIEIFADKETGSGQLDVEDLPGEFDWPDDKTHPDLIIMRKLSVLQSYDIYSLRITLREQGIPVNDDVSLKLSDDKQAELAGYMRSFTMPLIMQIYGSEDVSIQSFQDVVGLFKDPDVKKAREKLQQMAQKLDIDLMEVPKFLEDYGDIFLSLSYYRNNMDNIMPVVNEFLDSMEGIRSNWQLRNDPALMKTCTMVENTINETCASISGRFETFNKASKNMWKNLNAERFRQVKNMIESYHTVIGGILCGLTVKMMHWKRLFPDPNLGGPVRRSEFIMSEMKQGIDRMRDLEKAQPMGAALNIEED